MPPSARSYYRQLQAREDVDILSAHNNVFMAIVAALGLLATVSAAQSAPVALRVENFTIPPTTGPVTHLQIKNLRETSYAGVVCLELPEGWRWSPSEQPVSLGPKETKRIPFTIEKAVNLASNSYSVRALAIGGDAEVSREQSIVCASTPYFAPEIDGKLKEWADALPVRFTTNEKETTFYTYWTRRTFYLAVTVEEEEHAGIVKDTATDAIQFALATRDAQTGSQDTDVSARYEFLVAGGTERRAAQACYALMKPGTLLSVSQQERALSGLKLPDAQVAVRRAKGVTTYECALPFSSMPDMRPAEGREFCFSLLVHDPDGTGIRDWGQAAGLWPSQRNKYAWSSWAGVKWGDEAPYDSKVEWGFCSSIH
jgi:hypothetical protein